MQAYAAALRSGRGVSEVFGDPAHFHHRSLQMVNRAANDVQFQYLDELPFELDDQHRRELCEYCFFGGPDKYAPLI